jgi:hypothetical protein
MGFSQQWQARIGISPTPLELLFAVAHVQHPNGYNPKTCRLLHPPSP